MAEAAMIVQDYRQLIIWAAERKAPVLVNYGYDTKIYPHKIALAAELATRVWYEPTQENISVKAQLIDDPQHAAMQGTSLTEEALGNREEGFRREIQELIDTVAKTWGGEVEVVEAQWA